MEDPRKKSKCIVCGEEKPGIDVKVDYLIEALRWLNLHTIRHKNPYRPVVCRECFNKYTKSRKSFETKRIAYVIIGVVFACVVVVASRASPFAFLAGLAVIFFMYLLSLISYMPALDIPEGMMPGKNDEKKQGHKSR